MTEFQHLRFRTPVRPFLAFTVGMATSVALFLWIHTQEQNFERFKLEQRAHAYNAAIRYELEDLMHELQLVNRVLESFTSATPQQLQTLSRSVRHRFSYINEFRVDAKPILRLPQSIPSADRKSFSVTMPVINGSTVTIVDPGALVASALHNTPLFELQEFDIRIYSGTEADESQLVYRRHSATHADGNAGILPSFLQQRIKQASTFDAAGMLWHVVTSSRPPSFFQGSSTPLLALLAGLLLSLTAAYWMHLQVPRLRHIQREVDQRNSELLSINDRLVDDIAARKRAEEDLRQAQHVLMVAQKLGHLGSWELDAANGELRISDELFRILGLEPQCRNLTLDDVLAMTHPDDREATRNAIAGTRDEGKQFRMKGRLVRPDGSVRHIITVGEATRDQSGRLFRVTGSVLDITEQKETELALRHSQQELRELAAHQERIREDERKRIAREVHDALGSLLAGIKAYLSVSMDRGTSAGNPADPLIAEASELVDRASETVRELITELRPSVLDQLGIWEALQWYAGQIERRTQMECKCLIDFIAAATPMDAERSVAIFRIVQEALTNVVRHAHASCVTIRAMRRGNSIVIEVEDNGIGCDPELLRKAKSWGIVGMHERARYLGGEFTIDCTSGKGTIATLRLPMDEAMEERT